MTIRTGAEMRWVEGNPYALQDAVQASRERDDERAEEIAESRDQELEAMDWGDEYPTDLSLARPIKSDA